MHTPFQTGCLRCPNCTLGTSDSSNATCSSTVRERHPNYWESTRKDLARSAANGCRSHKTYTVRHVGIAAIARAEMRRFVGCIVHLRTCPPIGVTVVARLWTLPVATPAFAWTIIPSLTSIIVSSAQTILQGRGAIWAGQSWNSGPAPRPRPSAQKLGNLGPGSLSQRSGSSQRRRLCWTIRNGSYQPKEVISGHPFILFAHSRRTSRLKNDKS